MTAQNVNLTMDSGEDWHRVITPVSNPPVALTDAYMEIRNANYIVVAQLTTANGMAALPGDGTIVLSMTAQQTLPLGIGFPGMLQSVGYFGIGRSYLYDLFGVFGQHKKIMHGFLTVTPAITRILS